MRRFGRFWKACPRGARHFGAARAGGNTHTTGSSQEARAGAGSVPGQPGRAVCQPGTAVQPLRVGSRPGNEGSGREAKRAGRPPWRGETGQGPARGEEEAGQRGSSRALSFPSYQRRLFLLPRPPSLPLRRVPTTPARPRPGPAWAAAEGGPGGAGGRGRVGWGSADGKSGGWKAGIGGGGAAGETKREGRRR